MSSVTRDADGSDCPYSISIRRATSADTTLKHRWTEATEASDGIVRAGLQYEVSLDDKSMADSRRYGIGCAYRLYLLHFLPERIALGVDLVPETARFIVSALIGDSPRVMPRRPFVGRERIIPKPVIDYILSVAKKIEGADLRDSVRTPKPAVSIRRVRCLH